MLHSQCYSVIWEFNVTNNVIDIKGLRSCYGSHVIHENLDLQIQQGEIIAIVGGSGSGKTTLLRKMLMLEEAQDGKISLFDQDIASCSPRQRMQLQQRCGVMFQQGALFSSLTVLENVCFPLHEFTQLKPDDIKQIALIKIHLAQFPIEAIDKYPAELSGGMLKRAALARAIALDPQILFLDEPTAGLDPESAEGLDELVIKLQQLLQLTIVMVTHDLDTLVDVTDRIAFLAYKRVVEVGSWDKLQASNDPEVHQYFHSARALVRNKQAQEGRDGNTN